MIKLIDSGVGSPGNETTYFGDLTKIAVKKFQIKYSDYVLKPVGLAFPTGYVGAFTRDFLNKTFSDLVKISNTTNESKIKETHIKNTKTQKTLLNDNFTNSATLTVS